MALHIYRKLCNEFKKTCVDVSVLKSSGSNEFRNDFRLVVCAVLFTQTSGPAGNRVLSQNRGIVFRGSPFSKCWPFFSSFLLFYPLFIPCSKNPPTIPSPNFVHHYSCVSQLALATARFLAGSTHLWKSQGLDLIPRILTGFTRINILGKGSMKSKRVLCNPKARSTPFFTVLEARESLPGYTPFFNNPLGHHLDIHFDNS